jgi:pimeloyl-ACP methyl ester carboxylesterase
MEELIMKKSTYGLASILDRKPFVFLTLICALLAATPSLETTSAKANRTFQKDTASANKATPEESRFATLDGIRIHYVNYGRGDEAIVFIHGWTCNLNNWRQQFSDFAGRTRVIAIDLPGHGQSDKPQITYSMDLFAKAVDAVLRDAKVSRAVLLGHSMGTPVARQFYRKYTPKTLAIVVVDGPLRQFADKATMEGFMQGFRGPNYKEALTQMFGMMMGPNLSKEAKQEIAASALNTPQHVLLSAMESMIDASIWGDDKINVPVLAILAKNPLYPPNIEELNRGVAPNIEGHMWEGVGHFVMMDKPKEFNEVVLAFLDRNSLLKK